MVLSGLVGYIRLINDVDRAIPSGILTVSAGELGWDLLSSAARLTC